MKRALMISAITLSLGLIGVGSSNAASITTYSNQNVWEAAAGSPIVVEAFQDSTLVSGLTYTFGNNVPPGSFSGFDVRDVAVSQFNDLNNPHMTFGTPTLAFGADWDLSPGGVGDGVLLALTFSDSSTMSVLLPTNILRFFYGFVSDTGVSSMILNSPGTGVEEFGMDNVRFLGSGGNGGNGSNGGAVPEPSSLLLLGSAVAGLGLWRKFKARS
jgi:hypothetical protein